jgi:hypothetical protein
MPAREAPKCRCGDAAPYTITVTNASGTILDAEDLCRECLDHWRPIVDEQEVAR